MRVTTRRAGGAMVAPANQPAGRYARSLAVGGHTAVYAPQSRDVAPGRTAKRDPTLPTTHRSRGLQRAALPHSLAICGVMSVLSSCQ